MLVNSTLRVSKQGKDQLLKLKRTTGMETWASSCRWALAVSLKDASVPILRMHKEDSNVEIAWRTLTGRHSQTFEGLIYIRALRDDVDPVTCLHNHVHRGLGILTGYDKIRNVEQFVQEVLQR